MRLLKGSSTRLKRIGCCLLAVFLSLPLAAPVNSHAAGRFSDTNGHWAEDYIDAAIRENIITGYPDGRFRPDKAVTRAEFAAMVNKALGNNGIQSITFSDVDHGDWYYNDVAKAMSASYTAGYDDNTFRPNNPITRQEAAVMIARIVPTYGENGNLGAYSDRSRIADWAYESLEKVNGKGYLGAYADGKIHPLDQLTRAQTAKIISEIIDHETIIVKNATIDDDGTKLSNRIYSNNVTIDEELGDDSAAIENCMILGSLSVQGGGTDSITVSNSRVANAAVNKEDDSVRLIAKGETAIVRLSASKTSILQTSSLKGGLFGPGFGNITVNNSAEVTLRGSFPKVNVSGTRAEVVLDSGKIETLTVGGRYSHVTAESGTTISTATVNAQCYFHGSGTISQMNVNADDITYETKPKRWTIAHSADTPTRENGTSDDISFSPKNGATNVNLDAKITITFDSEMELHDGDSISNSDIDDFIELRKGSSSGSQVDFSAAINSSNKVITITPDSYLSKDTKYYLIVEEDSIRDDDGDSNEKQTISFTTGDDYHSATTPVLSNFRVTPGDTSVTAAMTPNLPGKVYAVVVSSGSTAPSAVQIAAGQNSSGVPALGYAKNENVSAAAPVTLPAMGGLASGAAYDVWAALYSPASGAYSTPVKQSVTTTMPRITLRSMTVKPIIAGTTGDNQIVFSSTTYSYKSGLNSSITGFEIKAEGDSTALITLTGNGLGTKTGSGSLTAVVDAASNPLLTVTIASPGKTSSSYTISLSPVNDTSLKTFRINGNSQTIGASSFFYALPTSVASSVTLDVTTNDPYAAITAPMGAAVTVNTVRNVPGSASFTLVFAEGSGPAVIAFHVISGSSMSNPPYTLTFTRP